MVVWSKHGRPGILPVVIKRRIRIGAGHLVEWMAGITLGRAVWPGTSGMPTIDSHQMGT